MKSDEDGAIERAPNTPFGRERKTIVLWESYDDGSG